VTGNEVSQIKIENFPYNESMWELKRSIGVNNGNRLIQQSMKVASRPVNSNKCFKMSKLKSKQELPF